MRKLALGIAAAGAIVAATAVPASAQVGVYAGPGGFGVELGGPGITLATPVMRIDLMSRAGTVVITLARLGMVTVTTGIINNPKPATTSKLREASHFGAFLFLTPPRSQMSYCVR